MYNGQFPLQLMNERRLQTSDTYKQGWHNLTGSLCKEQVDGENLALH